MNLLDGKIRKKGPNRIVGSGTRQRYLQLAPQGRGEGYVEMVGVVAQPVIGEGHGPRGVRGIIIIYVFADI